MALFSNRKQLPGGAVHAQWRIGIGAAGTLVEVDHVAGYVPRVVWVPATWDGGFLAFFASLTGGPGTYKRLKDGAGVGAIALGMNELDTVQAISREDASSFAGIPYLGIEHGNITAASFDVDVIYVPASHI